jgi:4-hydroxybenzoate polyprenyltransferase
MTTLRKLLELIRFSHTVFALPFALLAAVMAWRLPLPGPGSGSATLSFGWRQLLGILLCMVFARSAAMAFNRLADRDIDAGNPRTSRRHLVTGDLSVGAVWWFAATMSGLFVASTVLFLPNRWPLYLSVPVLLFLCAYSWTKRFTALAHFWLGVALMLAPICTWIALRGEWLSAHPSDILPVVILGAAVLMWVSGFDMIYACQDAEYDRRTKLHSIPAWLGVPGALRLAAACHMMMILLLASLPWICPQTGLGWIYGLGVAAVAGLLVYEHWLVEPDDLTRVNVAFLNVNAVISIGLFCIVTLDLWT